MRKTLKKEGPKLLEAVDFQFTGESSCYGIEFSNSAKECAYCSLRDICQVKSYKAEKKPTNKSKEVFAALYDVKEQEDTVKLSDLVEAIQYNFEVNPIQSRMWVNMWIKDNNLKINEGYVICR